MKHLLLCALLTICGCASTLPNSVELPQQLPASPHYSRASALPQVHFFPILEREEKLKHLYEEYSRTLSDVDETVWVSQEVSREVLVVLQNYMSKMEKSSSIEEFIQYHRLYNAVVDNFDKYKNNTSQELQYLWETEKN